LSAAIVSTNFPTANIAASSAASDAARAAVTAAARWILAFAKSTISADCISI
jgi:hypothetical protein